MRPCWRRAKLERKAKPRKDEEAMTRIALSLAGVVAWASVGLLAALIAFNIGDKNQVLMFLPILAAVVLAWAIGELVTERVFNRE
jgi:uncharacterized membrane protein